MRNSILTSLIIIVTGFSCKKSSFNDAVPAAAINIINAAPDVPSLNVNFTSNPLPYYLYQAPIFYGKAYEWTHMPGDSPVVIVSSVDTSGSLYAGNLSMATGGIYSLYVLSGASKGDILFMRDSLPVHQDSLAGIRFINLSSDSHPITINLEGFPATDMVAGPLAYKEISEFKAYDAKTTVANESYNFEVRDQATGDLLTTYSWTFTVFKNNTVVISGSVDPSSATPLLLFPVNNF